MGIAGSQDIFQSKMLELMKDLEHIRAYLDDLLCIFRSSLEDHLEKLEEVLRHLCNAGLKVNAEKSTFCTLEIEYLGYILTRDGIKSQSNKVQAILPIQPPTNVKELRHFLGMVQYYMTSGQDGAKCLPFSPSPHGLVRVVRPKSQEQKGQKKHPGIGMRFTKSIRSR